MKEETGVKQAQHHPIFNQFLPCWVGEMPQGYTSWDWLGIKTKAIYYTGINQSECSEARVIHTSLPAIDEQYFEWVTLLESLTLAGDSFTMIEFGAGWGRWICRGATLAKRLGKNYHIIGVEPDSQHFQWMLEHLNDNEIDMDKTWILHGIVSTKDGMGLLTREPPNTYGQSEISNLSRLVHGIEVQKTVSISLNNLLSHIREPIDLIDIDIQGTEAKVVSSAIDALDKKVKCLFIETHSKKNCDSLTGVLQAHKWNNIYNFPDHQKSKTEFGELYFGGGVQMWRNSR